MRLPAQSLSCLRDCFSLPLSQILSGGGVAMTRPLPGSAAGCIARLTLLLPMKEAVRRVELGSAG